MILTNLNNCLTIYFLELLVPVHVYQKEKLFKANLAINIFSLYFASFTIIVNNYYNQVPNSISTQQPFFLVIFCLLQGSGLHSSEVVQGMVFKREVEGDINALQNAKIVAFSCPLDAMTTETKVG